MNFTNVKERVLNRFFEGMTRADDSWSKIYNVHNSDGAGLRIAALTGVGDIPTWDGTASLDTAAIDSTGALDMTYQARGLQVRIDKYTASDVPGIVDGASRKLGASIASTYASVAWTEVAAAFTGTIADTKALCATDHTMTSGTRSNKGTSALSRSALYTAIKSMNTWQNYQTQKYPTAMGGHTIWLVVHPENYQIARQIVGSSVAVAAGGDAQSEQIQLDGTLANSRTSLTPASLNVLGTDFNIAIIQSPWLSDTNDWFLIADPSFESPLHFWERAPVEVNTVIDQDTQMIKINCTFACVADSGPQPDGIFGSSVS